MTSKTTHIVSYPKSGRTWLRLLVAKYLAAFVPDGGQYLEDLIKLCEKSGIPRIILMHAGAAMRTQKTYTEPELRIHYRNQKVLFISRNIEDILVSAFYQAKYRNSQFAGDLSDFIRSESFGAVRVLTYYRMWESIRNDCSEFHLLRYEHLHKNTRQELIGALIFLGIAQPCKDAIEDAIEYCRFENLQSLERNNEFTKKPFQARDTSRIETYKFRNGAVGDYRNRFDKKDTKYLSDLLTNLNYDLLTSALSR